MQKPFRILGRRAAAALTATALLGGALGSSALAVTAPVKAPAPPTNLLIHPGETSNDGTVVLTWNAPADADIAYYQVFRSNGSGTPVVTPVTFRERTQGNEAYFVDSIPTEGLFRYALVAVNKDGKASLPSVWAGVTVDLPANGDAIAPDEEGPATPYDLDLGGTYSDHRQVTLKWNHQQPDDLWRYLIYRADGNSAATLAAYVDGSKREFTETLPADGTYTYTVQAQDRTGNVSEVSAALAIAVDTTAPKVSISEPANGKTYPQTGTIHIATKIEESGVGYEASAVEYFLDGVALPSATLDLADLTVGAHQVKVVVTDRAGNVGQAENLFVIGTTAADPKAPQTPAVSEFNKSHSVKLTWKAPAATGLTGYLIYRSQPGQPDSKVTLVAAGNLQFTDEVPADGAYSYRIAAMYGDGSEYSALPVTTTVDTIAPAVTITEPVMAKSYTQSGTLKIKATITEGGSGYLETGVKYYLDGKLLTTPEIALNKLVVGAHTVKMTVTDKAGNEGTAENIFLITAPVVDPKAPQELTTAAYSKTRSVALAWKAPATAGVTQYKVWRTPAGGTAKLVTTLPASALKYTDTVAADGSFAYHVTAHYQDGTQAESNTVSTIVDTAAPKVTITEPTSGKTYPKSGRIAIQAVVDEKGAGYEQQAVKYYLDGKLLSSATIDLATLTTGQHTVKVQVTDKAGNLGSGEVRFAVGNAASDPAEPQEFTVAAYQKTRSVKLSWKAPLTTGVADYLVYRTTGNGSEVLVTALSSSAREYTDRVAADGIYTYRVEARYTDGQTFSTDSLSTTVDTVAPVIVVNNPEDGTTYGAEQTEIAIDVAVTDATSGVADGKISYFLNGKRITAEVIDLTTLEDGEYTFKVEAMDQAGNKASKSVSFNLGTGNNDDDDDDDHDDDHHDRPRNEELLKVLAEVKSGISHGHYNALQAFARNGNLKAFRDHVTKFQGKFISREAAEKLLKWLDKNGEKVYDKHDDKGHSKGKGRNR